MHLKSPAEVKQGGEVKLRRQSLIEFKQFEAAKAREVQQRCKDKLKMASHKKENDKQFLKRLENDLYELGKRERMIRQRAKEEASKYNNIVSKQICQRCCEAEKETIKVWMDASNELHFSIMKEIE